MAQRRWGVTQAPGTAVVEREGIPQLTEGLMGGAAFVGACEKGPLNQVIEVFSWKDFLAKCGDLIAGTFLPDAVKGYFQEGGGNGRAFVVRVADGKQTSALLDLYNADGDKVLTLTAKSPGAWAGHRALVDTLTVSSVSGEEVTLSGRGSTTTYPLGFWAGGILQKRSGAGPYTWTDYGIVSEASGAKVTVRNATGLTTADNVRLYYPNPKGLAVVIKESPQDPTRWNLIGFYNGNAVVAYENLSLDPEDARFVETVINKDDSNLWFTAESQYSGNDFTGNRPYNDRGVIKSTPTTNDVTLETLANASADMALMIGDYVGGYAYLATNPAYRARIKAAAISTADIVLTLEGTVDPLVWAADAVVVIEAPFQFSGGWDGALNNLSSKVQTALEVSTSPLATTLNKGNGLIKVCTPGYGGDAAVAKAGIALAEAYNYQYRVEAANNVGPEGFKAWVETSVGRSDFAKAHYPSWMLIREGDALKEIPTVGDVLGEEARIVTAYSGYFKAEAGLDAVLSRCLGLCVGSDVDFHLQDYHLEYLTPAGVNCLAHKQGNVVIWGGRTLSQSATWRWAHMREQMSHYEHMLLEGYDWIIFAINNPEIWPVVYNNLEDYFIGQWKRGAIYGSKFEDACTIVVNGTNNTKTSIDAGELHADVTLQFSGTVERFVISVGRASLSEKTLA